MKPTQAVNAVTADMIKGSIPDFGVGDTVRVSVKVVEGSRERTQVFEGVVMRKRGGGINANFTVRRIASHGIGVERTFLLHSPRVEKIEVVRRGVVRRAQLYYLRGRTGKAARIKERRYRPGAENARVQIESIDAETALATEMADVDEDIDDAELEADDELESDEEFDAETAEETEAEESADEETADEETADETDNETGEETTPTKA